MENNRRNIFFIASWFPNRNDLYEGDFVLRHAKAIALYNNVFAVYAIECDVQKIEIEKEIVHDSLVVYRIYLPRKYNKSLYKINYYQQILKIFNQIHAQTKIDIVHANVLWRAGLAALFIKKIYAVPYVLTEHSSRYDEAYYQEGSIQQAGFFKKLLHKKIIANSAYCFCVSNFQIECMRTLEANTQFVRVSNVVDTNFFTLKKETNANTVFTFLHVSMLTFEKNIDWLLQSIAKLKTLKIPFILQIVGPTSIELQNKIEALHIQSCTQLIGLETYENIAKYMQTADCLILCSTKETQGCVAIESQCCGTPVIASDIGGLNEYVSRANGLLVDLKNSNSLLEAMQQMMQNKRIFNAKNISDTASKLYSYEAIGNEINLIYKKVQAIRK